MAVLATQFRIHISCVHRTIHHIIPLMHVALVNKYIKWPTMAQWTALAGFFPDWPRVVDIMDCTPFRISKPKGIKIVAETVRLQFYFLNFCLGVILGLGRILLLS